ncbi:MAG: DMT family transporter [Candidatus Woesearchaeota archaeon]|nr:DMT family transporter [Candidatus Woesearchaeota archaeon]
MTIKGVWLVFATALISGVSIFLNKFSVSMVQPYLFTFLKNIMTTLFLFSLLLLLREFSTLKTLSLRHWGRLVVIGLVGGSIPFLLFFKGLSLTSSAAGSFVHKTMFIFVAALALFFLKEKLHKTVFISALLLLAGNFLLLKLQTFSFGKGELLILLATVFWAAENILSKDLVKTVSGTIVAFGRMFFGSLFILLFLTFTQDLGQLVQLTGKQFLWILFTSLLLLGYTYTWYNGIKTVKITTATAILLLGSPITTLLNFIFVTHTLSVSEFFGSLLLIAGVSLLLYFVERKKTRQDTFSTA